MPRKRINFFKALGKKFKGIPDLYLGGKANNGRGARIKGTSPLFNPVKTFKAIKARYKRKHKSNPGLRAFGQSVRIQLMNGPWLNVALLGIPWLIDFGVSYGTKSPMFSKKVPPRVQHEDEEVVMVEFDPDAEVSSSEGGSTVSMSDLDPLPSAPYSDVAFKLYAKLVAAGMTKDAAHQICSGELNGEDLGDHLSDDDIIVFMGLYGTAFKEGETDV